MAGKTNRLQILLDEDRYRRLQLESKRTGASVGSLVRDAIDQRYASLWPDREEAGRRLLAAEPMDVGDWDAIERELEDRYPPS